MNRRLTMVIIAVVVAVISFVISFALALVFTPQTAAAGEQTAINVATSSTFGALLLGDSVILMAALAVTYVVGVRRKVTQIPDRLQGGVELGVGFLKNRVFTALVPTETRRRPMGLIALGVLAVIIIGFFGVPFFLLPALHLSIALPVIKLPGESFSSSIPVLTNTLMGTFIADILAVGFVFLAARNLKEVPGRLQSLLEMVVEFFDNLAKQMAGPIARKLLPLVLTVFLFLLFANWIELVPGVDSIGTVKCAEAGSNGYGAYKGVFGLVVLDVSRPLDSGKLTSEEDLAACEKVTGGAALSTEEQQRADITTALDTKPGTDAVKVLTPAQLAVYQAKDFKVLRPNLHVVTSFVRAAATDLNLTLMLAILAFVVIQFYGIQANGGAYFYKFINVPAMRQVVKAETPGKKAFAGIDIFVGLLEGISELAKILSFGFRLFGNIFAGQALLFVMTFLVATLLPVIFYGLELFVGLIQAYVFAMLILMFSGMAIAGHHSEDDHGSHDEHGAHDLVAEGGGVSPL